MQLTKPKLFQDVSNNDDDNDNDDSSYGIRHIHRRK